MPKEDDAAVYESAYPEVARPLSEQHGLTPSIAPAEHSRLAGAFLLRCRVGGLPCGSLAAIMVARRPKPVGPIKMLTTIDRGFFQVLREDFLPPFPGRKEKRKPR